MTGNNSFDVKFNQADFLGLVTALESSAQDVNLAANRAARRTMAWMRVNVAKDCATLLGIPASRLKTRIRQRKLGNNQWSLFVGTNPLPYDRTGKVGQSTMGMTHPTTTVRAGWVNKMGGSTDKGFIRKGRAKKLGLKLPGLKGNFKEGANLPILRISHDLHEITTPIFDKYAAQGSRYFRQRFEHELRNIKR